MPTPSKSPATKAKSTPVKRTQSASPARKANRSESRAALAAPATPAKIISRVDPEVPLDPATGVVYHLGCATKDIADRFIFVGDPGRVPVVAERFDKGSVTFQGVHREIAIITGKYKGVPVTVLSTGMGTDNCEIVLNEIHALKDYNCSTGVWATKPSPVKIIRVGTCGCPNANIALGSLAITKYSIGMDNTCKFYNAPAGSHPPAVAALEKLVNTTTNLGKKVGVYTSMAASSVTDALVAAHEGNKLVAKRRGYAVGITASGSGFYGCQGRAVGRFRGCLAVPDLVDELGAIRFSESGKNSPAAKRSPRPLDQGAFPDGAVGVVNIEMENSAITFLSRCLGYEAGTVCAIIATRAGDKRAFATKEQASAAVMDAISVGLDALISIK